MKRLLISKSKLILYISLIIHHLSLSAHAQIPVEVFAGHNRSTLDILFFKYFKNGEKENSKWLLFNRNRAAIDYRMTATQFLPQFGITEAISYNHPALKGVAPVAVCQVFNRGVFPKAGIQYVLLRDQFTLFSWMVIEALKTPQTDHFLLLRYTPQLTKKIRLYSQFESLSTFPSVQTENMSFTQRFRLGCSFASWQLGAGIDLNESGRSQFTLDYNIGSFIRHEF